MDFFAVDADQLLWINFIAAGVLVLASVLLIWTDFRLDLNTKMDGAKWDLTQSWASNLTAIGAVATTVLASSDIVFPQDAQEATKHLTRSQYQGLSLFFVVVIIAAPFLFNSFRRGVRVGPDVEFQGFVVVFFVSAGLTLWAVLGQIWLIYMLSDELQNDTRALTNLASIIFQVGSMVLWVLALIYAIFSIRDNVEFYSEAKDQPGKHRAAPKAARTQTVDGYPLAPREPKRWSVL